MCAGCRAGAQTPASTASATMGGLALCTMHARSAPTAPIGAVGAERAVGVLRATAPIVAEAVGGEAA
eukprot:861178-Prymnesium_polylepis.1